MEIDEGFNCLFWMNQIMDIYVLLPFWILNFFYNKKWIAFVVGEKVQNL